MNSSDESVCIPMSKFDQLIISLFIASYFFIVGTSLLPNCPFKSHVHPFTKVPEFFLGIDQSWRMFCPNPRGFNLHVYAIITFKNGETAYYEFPRGDKMDQLTAALRERLRKHFYDLMPWDDFSVFRPSIARYLARCFNDPGNPPTEISLCYNKEDIKLLPAKMISREKMSPGLDRKTYFVYQVMPEDLK